MIERLGVHILPNPNAKPCNIDHQKVGNRVFGEIRAETGSGYKAVKCDAGCGATIEVSIAGLDNWLINIYEAPKNEAK